MSEKTIAADDHLSRRRVEEEMLRDHAARCVEHAIRSGDKADQRRKIAELMDVVGRAER
jgi:CsoR family transcriptional regulator, copper-sensing transcriptional repressor